MGTKTADATDNGNALSRARAELHRQMTLLTAESLCMVLVLVFLGALVTPSITHDGPLRALAAVAIVVVGGAPMGLVIHRRGKATSARMDQVVRDREHSAKAEVRRREFEAQVADALDMAEDEQEALHVVEQAFAQVVPDQLVELLLADHSHAHLERKAASTAGDESAGCPVAAPFDCPAARRARVHHFDDAEALNLCPKLLGRLVPGASAACLPVSVMGRAVGVIHTIGTADLTSSSAVAAQLGSVADQAGARLAMLRVMAETHSQAATDGLTGLLNRRAFENSWRQTSAAVPAAAVAMADLDHFKTLNDTYGHDTGDRALRMFAGILRSSLRADDLVSRRGGEEFAIYFPNCDAAAAVAGLQRVQQRLQTALQSGGLPSFTASFGVVEATPGEDLEHLLIRADAALFAAKRAGRDRVIVHDAAGAEQLYPATAFPAAATTRDAIARDATAAGAARPIETDGRH